MSPFKREGRNSHLVGEGADAGDLLFHEDENDEDDHHDDDDNENHLLMPTNSVINSGEGMDIQPSTPTSTFPGQIMDISQHPSTTQHTSRTGSTKPKTCDVQTTDDQLLKYLNLPICTESRMFREYVEAFFQFRHSMNFPSWLAPHKIRDLKGHCVTDSVYDYTTMWVPKPNSKEAKEEARPHYTPGMQQYWEIKKTRFDQIVLFKMGRFYEIFYIDACIAHTICDLRWMGDQKPHVGFPEQSLHLHAKRLVQNGYRVAVVEQMETPKELEERNRTTNAAKDKAVKREVNEVYTRGTLLHEDMLAPEARYLLALCFSTPSAGAVVETNQPDNKNVAIQDGETHSFGLCYVDVATCEFVIGFCEDGPDRVTLQTLLSKTTPVEILYCPPNTPMQAIKMFKLLPIPPQLSALPCQPSCVEAEQEIERYFATEKPDEAKAMLRDTCDAHVESLTAVASVCMYLRKNLIDKKVLNFAQIWSYSTFTQSRLLLDGNAIRNLEILQSQEGSEVNSLYGYLKHTSTAFGSRLLKKWICSPLCRAEDIDARLDCIDWFYDNQDMLQDLSQRLKNLPDVERLMCRVCMRGLESERGAVFFDNVHNTRLREFLELMDAFIDIEDMANCLVSRGNLPKRLGEVAQKLFPPVADKCRELRATIVQEDKGYKPAKGVDPEFDKHVAAVSQLQERLDGELESIAEELEMPLSFFKFTHTKFRYEVECPETLDKSKQRQLDITSTRKGFIRFHTDDIKELVESLETEEEALRDDFYPFMQRLFTRWYKFYDSFQAVLRLAAELDVLLSLAWARIRGAEPMCRPIIRNPSEDTAPILRLQNCRHPVAAKLLPDFVPNDTELCTANIPSSVLLVTGPNMGGKSTVLRQTCIAVVMAQLGSYVPAEECELSVVDKLFTRIGARDSILEGKSTFLVELEETSQLLRLAARHSLCMIDELGRGTSTFDGTAIALATLEHIALDIKCRCLFSTHFHLLCEEFRFIPNISNFHMAAHVDDHDGTVTFLYKFVGGACPKSYGMNVARLAGIDENVLRCATEKSSELEAITSEFHKLARYRALCRNVTSILDKGDDEELAELVRQNMQIQKDGAPIQPSTMTLSY